MEVEAEAREELRTADPPPPIAPVAPVVAAGRGAVISARQMWANTRFWMEADNAKGRRYGGRSHHHWQVLCGLTHAFAWGARVTGFYRRGLKNALDLRVRTVEHRLRRLPPAFDGFTVLQLSDLHIDGMPGLEEAVLDRLRGLRDLGGPGGTPVDLCVLTGDFRSEVHGPVQPALEGMRRVVAGIASRHGILGILGNHDSCLMVPGLQQMGVTMLVNESLVLERDGQALTVIGTDDVHWYFTDQAIHALEDARGRAFTLALVHSPELYDVAAGLVVDLYLCGHTHAGQICLPGGVPIIRHLNRGRRFLRGSWSYRGMAGFTHAGTGTSGVPLRFNTRGEIVVHRLVRTAGSP